MHPDRNCDDCGRLHAPYAAHEGYRVRRTADLGDALVLMCRIEEVLADFGGIAPETAADVLSELAERRRQA